MIRFASTIPVTIRPTFLIFSALIGWLISHSIIGALIWIAIIFVSVLCHELGHALTALAFGQRPRIELVALGGLTSYDGKGLSAWKQFCIVFNGPVAGFLLAVLAQLFLRLSGVSDRSVIGIILIWVRNANVFWTIVNLLPVLPLDGGQLLRVLLEAIFGAKGFKYALWTSGILTTLLSLFFFVMQNFLAGALFFLFAFQAFEMLRRNRHFLDMDRDVQLRALMSQLEELLQIGKKEEACVLCETILQKTQKGLIFETVTQYLALLKYEKGEPKEAYRLLKKIRSDLSEDALCLLHKVAFAQGDFRLVIDLSGACFQRLPTVETALLNAYAHAQLKEVTPALGWLQTAFEGGLEHGDQVFSSAFFDPIRQSHAFETFVHRGKDR